MKDAEIIRMEENRLMNVVAALDHVAGEDVEKARECIEEAVLHLERHHTVVLGA